MGNLTLLNSLNPFSTGVELGGAQFVVRRDTFTFSLSGRTNGTYYAWWSSCCRVEGINNVGQNTFATELVIPYVAGQASGGPSMIPATIDIIGRGYDYNQNLNSSDPDGTPVSYQLITNSASPDYGPTSSIQGLSVSQIGTVSISASNTSAMNLGRWVYKVRVTDGSGATAERDILVVAQDGGSNTPPVLNPIGSQAVAVNTPLSFSVSGTDPTNGQTLVLRAQRLPPGATFPSATNITPATVFSTFNWTPTNGQEGTYTVNFEVFDNAATPLIDSELVTITVTGGNNPPVLDQIGNKAVINGEALTFTITGSDPDASQSVNFHAFNLPAGATFDTNTATFTWTPSPAQYDNTFSGITFRVRDDGTPNLTDDETITITVGAGNRPPIISPVNPQTILAGQALTFNVIASDSNTAQIITLRPGTGGLPPGATFPNVQGPSSGSITSTFSWTPTIAQVGVHNVRFRVDDNGTPILSSEIIVPISVIAPDLSPTSLSAPTMVSVQESIIVSWAVTNLGTAQAPPSWMDRLYLSTDSVYDASDTHLGGFTRSSPLPAGSNYVQTQNVTMPSVAAGNYFLILRTDADGNLTESIEGNNNRSTPISVSVADLVVHSLMVQPIAQFGQTVDIAWTVTNTGTGTAVAGWSDRLVLSSDTVVGGDTTLLSLSAAPFFPLLPSASYTRTQSVVLPLTVSLQPGNYFILATANSGNSQFESNQNNNTTNAPIALSVPPLPDLVVTNIVAPLETFTERAFNVSWTICNQGQAAASGNWVDRIYLSVDDQVGNDRLLGEFPFSAGLTPGQCLTRVQSLNISRAGLTDGPHRIIVITDAANGVNEHNSDTNNATVDSDPIMVRLSPQPDLRVTRVQVPANAFSSQQTVVEWDITNAGNGSTGAANWQDYAWLSTDAVLDGSDTFLGQAQNTSYLNAGDSYRNTLAFTLPQGIDGDYFIIVKADGNNAVNEFAGENDNVGSGPMHVTLTPPPDLRVFSVTAPSTAFSGQPMNVGWRITNAGPGQTLENSWRDEIFLCRTNFLDGTQTSLGTEFHSGVLNQNASYGVTNRSVTLPIGISGNYYLLIRADTFNNVFEHVFEANNVGSETSPTVVNLTPPPDLEVELVSVPANALASQPLTVAYSVANNGATATPNSSWTERCYLSSDTVLSPGTDLLLESRTHFGALDAGASYSNTFTGTLPVGLTDTFYAIVQVDAGNQVFELVKTNNTRVSAGTVSVTWQPPDLVVELLSVPTNALASHTLSVSYRVANRGVIATPNTRWSERWFLSADQTLQPGSDLLLVTRNHFGSLAAGQSYTDSFTAALPDGLSGPFYAIVQTDSGNEVAELVKTNNAGASSNTVLVESRPADLVVTALDTPFDGLAGDVISVAWEVSNNGSGDTVKSRWNDRLVLSSDLTIGNGDDLVLLNLVHDDALNPGESYFIPSQTVPIPLSVAPGSYRLFLLTDTDSQVYEGTAENNNTSTPRSIEISRQTADLAVTRVSAPSAAQAGQSVRVEWAVNNIGAAGSFATYWSDSIYLSTDGTLDPDEITLLGTRQHSNELPPGGAYSNAFDYTFPLEASGDYYVIVLTDSDDRVLEPGAEGNNWLATTNVLHVTPAPVPDLAITALSVPTEAFAGQTFQVSWTVRNVGPGAATRNWYDAVYLSLDQLFDRSSDVYVGYADRSQALASGGEYVRTVQFTVPSGLIGPFYVFVAADSGAVVGEGGSEANNIAGSPISMLVRVQAPADLVVGIITVPTNAVAGQSVTLTYTVRNIGSNTASGTWIDSIYFSGDTQWDLDDALFARVTHSGVVPPGGSYTKTVTAPLPGLVPDDYHVIVRSDIRNQFPESNEANNWAASLDQTSIDVPLLQLGVPTTNLLQNSQSLFFRVDVGAGQTLLLRLSSDNPGSANEIFVRFGAFPSRSVFDFSYSEPTSPSQSVIIPTTQAGSYYVLIRGAFIPGGSEMVTLLAESIPFGLRSADPAVAGNAGPVTFLLGGAQLTANTQFRLADAGGQTHVATRMRLLNSAEALVTFDLTGAAPGLVRFQAIRGVDTGELTGAAQILVGHAGELAVDLEAPSSLRPGQLGTWSLRYRNAGNTDLQIPLLLFHLPQATFLSTSPSGPSVGDTLIVLGLPKSPLTHALRPGEVVTIPVYGKIGGSGQGILTVLDTSNPTVGGVRFDYARVLNQRLSGASPAAIAHLEAIRRERGETLREFYVNSIAEFQNILTRGVAYRTVRNINGRWHFNREPGRDSIPRPIINPFDYPALPGDPHFVPLAHFRQGFQPANQTSMPADGLTETHVIIVDDSDYSNRPGGNDLPATEVDGNAMYDYFHDHLGIPESQITRLSDRQGNANDILPSQATTLTPQAILEAVANSGADGDDNLVIYYAGHGDLHNGDWWLNGGSLTASDLSTALDSLGAGQNFVIPDSCFSGAFLNNLTADNTVGIAGSDADSVSWDSAVGGDFTVEFLKHRYEGDSVKEAARKAAETIRNKYASKVDPRDRQDPTFFNPDGVNVDEPWGEPSNFWDELADTIEDWIDGLPDPIHDPIRQLCELLRICDPEDTDLVVARDPNDIIGPIGFGLDRWVGTSQPLGYTIRFENDPLLATAPAQVVRITQQLDPHLDFRTFRLNEFGFGSLRVSVPENRAFFQTNIDLRTAQGLLVEVAAGINVATGEAFWEFASIDPVTGDLPTDALAGFLPVNTNSPAGEGFVSYSVRARNDVMNGDVVNAQARIVFDINEPIDTPPIFNTLDPGVPVSAVQPLPTLETNATFLVSWSGSDAAGGSAIASYDIYVSTDGGPYQTWLANTVLTSAYAAGERGRTYAFYSVARDNVGNREAAPPSPDTTIRISDNVVPVLASIPDFTVAVGNSLRFTNTVADSNVPAQSLRFTLMAGGATGATIGQSNGVVSWSPQPIHAGSNYVLTVTVTDDGEPPLSDSKSFTVTVPDYVEVAAGTSSALAGDSGTNRITIAPRTGLSGMTFELQLPPNRLANPIILGRSPEIASATVQALSDTRWLLTLGSITPVPLPGAQPGIDLGFTVQNTPPSAFVPVVPASIQATRSIGGLVPTTASVAGRVVVLVNPGPLLEMTRDLTGAPLLSLFGNPGTRHVIESKASLGAPSWTTWWDGTLTNIVQGFPGAGTNGVTQFFRARTVP